MRLVMVVFTALSFGACMVEEPGAGEAKITPEKPKGEYGVIDVEDFGQPGVVGYFLAEADKKGYPDQRFVLYDGFGSSPGRRGWMIDIRAVDENLNPLPGPNDCVDRFTGSAPFYTDSVTISKGRNKVKIEWNTKAADTARAVTAFEYTVISSGNEQVTYKYKNQNATPDNTPTVGEISHDHWVKLLFGGDENDCDTVSQSGEEGSGAPGGG